MYDLTLAYVLIAAGLVLLLAEVFIPSGGLITVAAIALIAIGVILAFSHGGLYSGLVTLIVVFLLAPAVEVFALYIWPLTPLGKRMMLRGGSDDDATVATMPVNLELEQLRGRLGKAASPLRPSGVVEFDGRRIDVITEGMMIEAGKWVRCIDVKAGKVVVRLVDAPPDIGDLENMDIT
ncbi:MAG: serine protease [Gemmataceae bacterium]